MDVNITLFQYDQKTHPGGRGQVHGLLGSWAAGKIGSTLVFNVRFRGALPMEMGHQLTEGDMVDLQGTHVLGLFSGG